MQPTHIIPRHEYDKIRATLGGNHVYIATVEGWPTLEDAIVQMKNDNIHDVFMAPFLLCAGEHVKNDM